MEKKVRYYVNCIYIAFYIYRTLESPLNLCEMSVLPVTYPLQ